MNKISFLILIFLISSIGFYSCQKKDNSIYPPLSIDFLMDSGLVFQDTSFVTGHTFKVGITASSPDINLTNFIIKVETDTIVTVFDTGFNNAGFSIEKTLTKGLNQEEIWHFIIRDRHTESSEISLVTKLDTSGQYGDIVTIENIDMGAQSSNNNSFFSFTSDQTFDLENAFQNQEIIDLVYYYDFIDGDENVISSPGANIDESVFPGEYSLSNWTTRNTYRFKTSDVTPQQFSAIQNDSLLLAAYGQSEGKRKAKNLSENKVIAFKKENGKTGLFIVNSVEGTDEGNINITIKVQK